MLRRSGVEIEFAHDTGDRSLVAASLARQGIVAEVESYGHAVREHWKVTTDSSCGFELVSPILTDDTARSIAPAMRAVSAAGGYVTDHCGLHVHIEVPQHSMDFGLQVAGLYHDIYEMIAPLIPESRRDNRYAQFNDDREQWLSTLLHDRYQAVNVQVLNRQPTVEFRQFEGTLNAVDTWAWMNLCDLLVTETAEAEGGASLDSFRKRLRYQAPIDALEHLQAKGLQV